MAFALHNPFGFSAFPSYSSSFFDDDFGFFSEPSSFSRRTAHPRRVAPPSCGASGRCYAAAAPQIRRRCGPCVGGACFSAPSYAAVASAAPRVSTSRQSNNNNTPHTTRRTVGGNGRRTAVPSSFLAPASVFELLNIGSDFQRFWDDIYDTANLLENTSFDRGYDNDGDDGEWVAESVGESAAVEAPKQLAPAPAPAASSSSSSSTAVTVPSSSSSSSKRDVALTTTAPAAPAAPAPAVAVATTTAFHGFGDVSSRVNEDESTQFDIRLPGLTSDDVKLDLDLEHHALSIKAEKRIEDKHSFRHVSVTRVLPIDRAVKAEHVHADFIDGTLHITVASPSKAIEAAAVPTTSTNDDGHDDSAAVVEASPPVVAHDDATAVATVPSTADDATTASTTASSSDDATTSSDGDATATVEVSTPTDEAPAAETASAASSTVTLADSSEVSVEDATDN